MDQWWRYLILKLRSTSQVVVYIQHVLFCQFAKPTKIRFEPFQVSKEKYKSKGIPQDCRLFPQVQHKNVYG
jgi:hypothetical protein